MDCRLSPLAPGDLVSEYQYYDFRAIDRPLTRKEMAALRSISTRAAITTTSFTNHYEWGDLKANPSKLLEKYFDAFVLEKIRQVHAAKESFLRRLAKANL